MEMNTLYTSDGLPRNAKVNLLAKENMISVVYEILSFVVINFEQTLFRAMTIKILPQPGAMNNVIFYQVIQRVFATCISNLAEK